ncbi:MAG: YbbR-like domain-containing protein [Ignavibacteria bacterium]|nr:YbbR-like domain-containing protein [Ignavibacteria bacterium]
MMKNKRFHIILATVLVGILLWISVKLGFQYQTVVNAAVAVEKIPPGTAISSRLPRFLQLRLRGDGWQLVPVVMGPELVYPIDLRTFPYMTKIITLRDVAERLSMPMGVQVLTMNPDSLVVRLDRHREKRVPVYPDLAISFRDGYAQIGGTVVTPESVTVGGSENVLASLSSWNTQRVDLENVRSSVDRDVPLADTSGNILSFSPTAVRVRVEVQALAEKIFSGIPVRVTDVPGNLDVIIIPPKIDLVIRSGVERLSALSQQDFRIVASYNDLVADTSGIFVPEVFPPNGATLVSRRPERLQYVIRQRF